MDLSALDPIKIAFSLIVAALPLILAAMGELVTEKSGVLNLGVEGMMLMGAIGGFAVAVGTGSPYIGMLAGGICAMLTALIFGVLTQYFVTSQVPTGLALTLFGAGLSALIGQSYNGIKPPSTPKLEVPVLADIPVIGPVFFSHDIFVYLGIGMVFVIAYVLKHTRMGLVLRACGENHDAAHALGFNVRLIRLLAIAFGGMMAGFGGAYISLVRVPQWTEGMTAGAGWIALAIVVFGAWRPIRAMIGALLFGGVTILQLNLQPAGVNIQPEIMAMMPYLMTILVLVLISLSSAAGRLDAPGSLGKKFNKN